MLRALGVAHILIAIVLLPLALFPLPLAPILLVGPVWAMVLGARMWKRQPGVGQTLRRTHAVFLAVDVFLIVYGVWALRAAEASAARGGGLLGGIGLIPIVLGSLLAAFSAVVLALTWRTK